MFDPTGGIISDRRAFKHVDQRLVLKMFAKADVRTVLDVGCGIGNTVAHLVDMGLDAYGVTVSEEEIGASKVAGRLSLADIQRPLDHPSAPFDAVVSVDCLEHLPNILAALRNINAAIKLGGPFVCYIPPEKWTECDYHVVVYTPRQMKWLLNLTGFKLTAAVGRFRGKGVTYYAVKTSDSQLEPGKML